MLNTLNNYLFTLKQFLGIELMDSFGLADLVLRFLFNMFVILIIVRYIYYNVARRKDYFFTYILISSTVFILSYLLESVTLQLGFALGLFAIFGILRYRTTTIPIKEMTYLFLVIGISIINALSNNSVSYLELLFTNIVMIFITWGGETFWLKKYEASRTIIYGDMELLKPQNKVQLMEDLTNRTGLPIKRLEIGQVDYIKKTAKIKIFFTPDHENSYLDERMTEHSAGED